MAASCLRLLQVFCRKETIQRSTMSASRQYHNICPQNGMNETIIKLFERFRWMTQFAPVFSVCGNKITIIREPTEFYETLKEKARTATRRIVLSSLYLGNGHLEQQLVDSIHEAARNAKHSHHPLQIKILLEYTRGSRGTKNSRTMLLPLLQEYTSNVQISLYHSPDLRGLLKQFVPARFNEAIGLQHMKIYLFDDSLIISGANLSESYFTNRQDRNILLEDCPEIANFFTQLVSAVSSFSFQLQTDDTVTLNENFGIHPYKDDINKFKEEARRRVNTLLDYHKNIRDSSSPTMTDTTLIEELGLHQLSRNSKLSDNFEQTCSEMSERTKGANAQLNSDDRESDTLILPLIQMGPLGIRNDELATRTLLETAEDGTEIHLASGYFNLTESYLDIVLNKSKAHFNMLTANPRANGFFGAKGIAGSIPDAYTHIEKHFYKRVCDSMQQKRIQLFEYFRDKWTFHAKGLWYYLPSQSLPSFTLLGSPNFGYRSVKRDLEVQLAIVTTNEKLRRQLYEEEKRLFDRSTEVNEETFEQKERIVPYWARLVTRIIWRHL
ncbi:CDP-diacylglycerol--glycerol-3-phosphate 3-phosphatidyltransferase, mitochondrial-like [Ptychodera flava]|uniref:CDP-diacylglycerol--glycerol-3-phosphate 3-phosphatidyltransferase, mitochondrial-like n=1 Tax=Ptychodera flava TaxID=63121 RepID=UPI003969EDA4